MGPRSEERGEVVRRQRRGREVPGFNGAALRGARRVCRAVRLNRDREASMGPRSEERGESARIARQTCRSNASMGPRSEERGEPPCHAMPRPALKLQWGRAPRSAERHRHAPLQWPADRFNGAALRGARRAASSTKTMNDYRGFNGAALRGARRAAPSPSTEIQPDLASMGPRSEERGEVISYLAKLRRVIELQWGRAPRSAESVLTQKIRALTSCFNGAALRGARRDVA